MSKFILFLVLGVLLHSNGYSITREDAIKELEQMILKKHHIHVSPAYNDACMEHLLGEHFFQDSHNKFLEFIIDLLDNVYYKFGGDYSTTEIDKGYVVLTEVYTAFKRFLKPNLSEQKMKQIFKQKLGNWENGGKTYELCNMFNLEDKN
ncbi:MAG: hypothetical protein H6622_09565 [Halobacteriovoraceae bacterium]|nr:hypothetical protein [Halobacteriovoraceae bacterium]